MRPKEAFAVVWGLFLVAAVYRAIDFYVTGFFVPDEYAYLYYHLGDLVYQGRFFFNAVNLVWFGWLPSTDVKIVVMPAYLVFWFSIGLFSAWRTVKELGYDERIQSLTLLIAAVVPVYLLFSDGVITEAVAFPTAMLGTWLLVRFRRTRELWLPIGSALCFAAAAYTHLDFVVPLMLGWIFFLKRPVAAIAFAVPALFFLLWPVDVLGLGALLAGHFNQGVTGAIVGVGIPNNSHNPPGATEPGSQSLTFLSTISRAAYLLTVGGVGGFGLAGIGLMAGGLLLAFRRQRFTFLVGLFMALAFAGTAYLYAGATVVFLGTMVRYSFDLLPAFFVLAPLAISRINSKKAFAVLAIGLLGYGAVGASLAGTVLTQNLSSTYPFVAPGEDVFSLSYRAPMAAIRDWFVSHPQPEYTILGQDPLSEDGNLSNLWHFTPGTSGLNVRFLPYSYGAKNAGTFFLYVPSDLNASLQKTILSFKILPQSAVVLIAGGQTATGDTSYFFMEVSLA